jgi:chemotaxis methyl-accepting protein methylase
VSKATTNQFRAFPKSRISRGLLGAVTAPIRRSWEYIPSPWRQRSFGLAYGRLLHKLVCLQADRKQYFATFFLRNRPELELLCRLIDQKPRGSRLDLCVLACSKGAEVYSIAWAIRCARPDLQLNIHAIDISPEITKFAAQGVYSLASSDALPSRDQAAAKGRSDIGWNTSLHQNAWMFERMTKPEIDSMFEVEDDQAKIRTWLKRGITWLAGDACDPNLRDQIRAQDIVVANRFLCHMAPPAAQNCLRNIGRLVTPGGYLFICGVDLDVRTAVALELGWIPVPDLVREIHEGDASITSGWPLEYWGLEPFDERRPSWAIRFASVFQIGNAAEIAESAHLGHSIVQAEL